MASRVREAEAQAPETHEPDGSPPYAAIILAATILVWVALPRDL